MPNRFEIADDNMEEAEVLACMRLTSPLLLPDNEIGLCEQCGEAIQFRPHVPKLPKKMCVECVMPTTMKARAKGELVTIITPNTLADLQAFFQKKNAN